MGSPISGPQPPYNNPPIQPQFFQPSVFFISNVTLGFTTTVTTTVNVNYVLGQLCRLIIPPGFGCRELNEQLGYVISIPAPNQVVLNVDSHAMSAFITASLSTQPQILAVGEINSGNVNASGRVQNITAIPGSFINISPL
jgi:hypothetical protein